ncbi:MAG: geranylgeranylglyceryl/heptaprenylglyceryl phosphate synthase [Conexivisphaerales archaeon]
MNNVERFIEEKLSLRKHLLFALIDPEENIDIKEKVTIIQKCDVDAILLGGSTIADQITLDKSVQTIKRVTSLPVILFPGNITGISPHADAILFSSLLNSEDPYFLFGVQALAAPIILKYNIEVIPMGYLIIGSGQTAGFVGRARSFPVNKPELVASYALAAGYLGMRYVYLEAGSGANEPISPETVKAVRSVYSGKILVGGGIRSASTAASLAKYGADIIVVGNIIYESNFDLVLKDISKSVHEQ